MPASPPSATQPPAAVPTSGCSGKPLAAKLGLRPGHRVLAIDAPPEWAEWLAPWPEGAVTVDRPGADVDLVHAFVTERAVLARRLAELRTALRDDTALWLSWPKGGAKARIPTDVTEDDIRALALPLGWVDVKVCAVSDVWSGLKLVVRVDQRRPVAPGRASRRRPA